MLGKFDSEPPQTGSNHVLDKKRNQHSRVHYPFRGTYRRQQFNHSFPPDNIFPNNKSCIPHAQVISDEIEKKITMGATTVLGRVGEVPPPHIVMPFSIEPSKLRVIHDQQYLNCFMRHCPFKLNQVINLPRYLVNGLITRNWTTSPVSTISCYPRTAEPLWALNGVAGGKYEIRFARDRKKALMSTRLLGPWSPPIFARWALLVHNTLMTGT